MWKGIKIQEKEHTLKSALVLFFAELIATAMLMFLGCMGGMNGFKDKEAPSAQGGAIFGMTVASLIQMLGHVSGAHMNPVVTLAAFLWGSISLPMSLVYFIAQLIGATGGYAGLQAITPERYLNWGNNTGAGGFCTTTPAPGLTTGQVFAGEFIVTGMLILLCCGCWDTRNASLQDGVAIKFGILVAAISIAQGPYTGASMNPARTFGPSVLLDKWELHWVYWVAPLAAGAFVPTMYKLLFTPSAPEESHHLEITPLNSIATATKQ